MTDQGITWEQGRESAVLARFEHGASQVGSYWDDAFFGRRVRRWAFGHTPRQYLAGLVLGMLCDGETHAFTASQDQILEAYALITGQAISRSTLFRRITLLWESGIVTKERQIAGSDFPRPTARARSAYTVNFGAVLTRAGVEGHDFTAPWTDEWKSQEIRFEMDLRARGVMIPAGWREDRDRETLIVFDQLTQAAIDTMAARMASLRELQRRWDREYEASKFRLADYV